jgi:uncharacterized RDD family membrane protein YckC
MSAPSEGSANASPMPGYYPDPSIPGYIRYWNGDAWVPGTSRPQPGEGDPVPEPPSERASRAASAAAEAARAAAREKAASEALPAVREQPGAVARDAVTGPDADRSGAPVDWDDPRRMHGDRPGAAGGWDAGAAPGAGPAEPAQQDTGGRHAAPAADGSVPDPRGGWGAAPEDGGGQAPAASDGTFGAADGATVGIRLPRPAAEEAPAAPAPPHRPDATVGLRRSDILRMREEAAAAQTPHGGGQTADAQWAAPAPHAEPGPFPGAPPGYAETGYAEGYAAPAADSRLVPGPGGVMGPYADPAHGYADPLAGQALPAQGASYGLPAQQTGDHAPQAYAAPLHQQPQQHAPQAPVAPEQQAPAHGAPAAAAAPWQQQVHDLARTGGPAGQASPGGPEQVAPWRPPASDPFGQAEDRRPASLGKRLGARLVDGLLVSGVTAAAAVPFVGPATAHVREKIDAVEQAGVTRDVWLIDGTTGVYLAAVLGVFLVFGLLYEALPTARWGRTLGKRLFGLTVVDIERQDVPGAGAALRRWLTYSVLSVLVVGVVNVLWCLFDRPWRQCWHDKAARTFVAGD